VLLLLRLARAVRVLHALLQHGHEINRCCWLLPLLLLIVVLLLLLLLLLL
jgi:hypothetical protein